MSTKYLFRGLRNTTAFSLGAKLDSDAQFAATGRKRPSRETRASLALHVRQTTVPATPPCRPPTRTPFVLTYGSFAWVRADRAIRRGCTPKNGSPPTPPRVGPHGAIGRGPKYLYARTHSATPPTRGPTRRQPLAPRLVQPESGHDVNRPTCDGGARRARNTRVARRSSGRSRPTAR